MLTSGLDGFRTGVHRAEAMKKVRYATHPFTDAPLSILCLFTVLWGVVDVSLMVIIQSRVRLPVVDMLHDVLVSDTW